MDIKLDIQTEDVVRQFGDVLFDCLDKGDSLCVEFDDVDFCPNRIVPIVGLSDMARQLGVKIVLKCRPGSSAERACLGFIDKCMKLESNSLERTFGRVWKFTDSDELNVLVNAMEQELNRSAELAKGVRNCFVWCINEVMDNVLTHSQKKSKPKVGYIMVQYLSDSKLLKVCVFDTGVGLKESFNGSAYTPDTPEEAICIAVKQNVTSGDGQGNGLYGLMRLVGQSPQGKLHIRSDGGEFLYNPAEKIENARPSWLIGNKRGMTSVDFQLLCDGELSFSHVFPDAMDLVDSWVENHEFNDDGVLHLKVKDIIKGCGSRDAGKELRTVLINAIETDYKQVSLDFQGVTNCSSGFVDELIGKLILRYDFINFMRLVSIKNLTGMSALLINHSLTQRMAQRGYSLVASSDGNSGSDSKDSPNAAKEIDRIVETDGSECVADAIKVEGVSEAVQP